jgi:NTE family protein
MKSNSFLFSEYFKRISLIPCIFCSCLIFYPTNISAQEIAKRPTVGLVLSGGGAHGIAHLGVIKVMEEAGLRPDYITGVSMGSIIGGMYSLGYTADSLQKILKKINWEVVLSNKIPEDKVIFLEKNHFYNSIISLPLSSMKVVLPSGLINGQQVESTLGFYAWPAADINDFSFLPIPFMCVAADIINYKIVDLKTGYLADAIRASFSVPSIFTAFKIDSLLLLDGGLLRNFAASEAKEMGADILIGSFVGFKAVNEEEMQSVSGIIKQIAMFRSFADFEEQKKLVKVLIKPETEEYPVTEFKNIDHLVQKGYEAALPYKEYFRKLADSLNGISHQKPLKKILDKQSYTFDKIEVTGNKNYSDEQILGVLDIEPENKVDKYLLTDRIELLYGKAWFDKVKYKVEARNDSLILVIDCIEKPQSILYGSVHYDNSLLSGLILGLSVKNLLTQRSVININSFVGQYYRFQFNALQFIDKNQEFGISANFYSDNTLIPMLELRGKNIEVSSRNFTPGLSINRRIGLNHLMTISVNYENQYLIPHFDSDIHLKNVSFNYISSSFDYQINTIDTKYFPNKGTIFNISASTSKLLSGGISTDSSKIVFSGSNHGEFSFNRFYTFYGNIKHYFTPYGRLTFSIGGDVLLITDSDSVTAQNNFYLLGGIESLNKRSVPMVGFRSNEIPVKKMAGIRSELDIELSENIHLNLMANMFATQEANNNKGVTFYTGYGIGFGYMSMIGPIKIGLMYGNSDHEKHFNKTKGYISIGFNF